MQDDEASLDYSAGRKSKADLKALEKSVMDLEKASRDAQSRASEQVSRPGSANLIAGQGTTTENAYHTGTQRGVSQLKPMSDNTSNFSKKKDSSTPA